MIPFDEITRLVRQSEDLHRQIRQAIHHIIYLYGGGIDLRPRYYATYSERKKHLIEGFDIHDGITRVKIRNDFDYDFFLPLAEISPDDLLRIVHAQIKDLTEKQQEAIVHDLACQLASDQVPEPDHNPEGYARACLGHYDRLSALYATSERNICARCGTTQVSCEAHVNPNTREFLDYFHEAFYSADCSTCHCQILVDVPAVHSSIDALYKDYVNTHGREPLSARCLIVDIARDPVDDDATRRAVIRLSAQAAGSPDELCCEGIEGLKSLVFPREDRPFTLVEFRGFILE